MLTFSIFQDILLSETGFILGNVQDVLLRASVFSNREVACFDFVIQALLSVRVLFFLPETTVTAVITKPGIGKNEK